MPPTLRSRKIVKPVHFTLDQPDMIRSGEGVQYDTTSTPLPRPQMNQARARAGYLSDTESGFRLRAEMNELTREVECNEMGILFDKIAEPGKQSEDFANNGHGKLLRGC